jgi:hypothetical protein
MKNIKFLFVAIALLLVFTQIKAQNVTVSTALNNVLSAYYGVKNSLVTDKAVFAQSKAKELIVAINAVPVGEMNVGQQKIWASHTDKLLSDSKHISESTLENQRDYFTTLSKNLFEVFKGLKMNSTEIYQQYCPMKNATWLSETQIIKNPYYGKQMLSCGKTTETLAVETK